MNPLESKNDSHTEQLSAKVSRLKNIAIDIDNETKEHNRFLQAMRFDFDTARSFLGGGSRHLGNVMSSGKGDRRFMCYVIGVTNGFPLKINAMKIENVSVDYNRDFIIRILQRIEYDALRGAVIDLGLNELLPKTISETIQQDDKFLRKMHKILLEYEIEEGELICSETGRKFPILKGIPNMLLQKVKVS
ncbi:unnamed protein product [Rotaria sordida]|uniref:Multifunctional methyltransferase subunit TRM112-like protein n=1 Tax=Rotaria sordida TaxID=392033 RepID=A0A814AZE2_9BILA|nr:unnamed protein product [Rotaria sordida]CAF4224452.1 unnamed protein product [Rotaria sordida]